MSELSNQKRKDLLTLELRNIGFSVPESAPEPGQPTVRTIIDGITFTFEPGGFYAITGPNGSGKTTVAKLIMGINEPTQGQIIFNGSDITGLPINERSKAGIVYGFQHPENGLPRRMHFSFTCDLKANGVFAPLKNQHQRFIFPSLTVQHR